MKLRLSDREELRNILINFYSTVMLRIKEYEARKLLNEDNYKTFIISDCMRLDNDQILKLIDRDLGQIEYIVITSTKENVEFNVQRYIDLNIVNQNNIPLLNVLNLEDGLITVGVEEGYHGTKRLNFYLDEEKISEFNIHVRLIFTMPAWVSTIYLYNYHKFHFHNLSLNAFSLDLYKIITDFEISHLSTIHPFAIQFNEGLIDKIVSIVNNSLFEERLDKDSLLEFIDENVIYPEYVEKCKIECVRADFKDFVKNISFFRDFWHYTCPNY